MDGAHVGVTRTFGITAPAGGVLQKSEKKRSIEVAEVTGNAGVIAAALAKKKVVEEVTVSGVGECSLAAVVATDVAAGTALNLRRKNVQNNDNPNTFEMVARTLSTLS